MNTQDKIIALIRISRQLKIARDLFVVRDNLNNTQKADMKSFRKDPVNKEYIKEYVVRDMALKSHKSGSDDLNNPCLTESELDDYPINPSELLTELIDNNDKLLNQEVIKIILS